MRKIVLLALMLAAGPALSQGTHSVRGYVRSDGVYVPPHTATMPNSTKLDNWSTQGNTNPSTGQQGTVNPYRPTQSNPLGTPFNTPRH